MAFETDWFEWEYPPVTSCTQTQLRTRRDPKLFSSPAPKSSHGGLQDRPAGLQQSHTIGRNWRGPLVKDETNREQLHFALNAPECQSLEHYLQISLWFFEGNSSGSPSSLLSWCSDSYSRCDQQSGCVPSSPCAVVDTEGLTDATTGLNMCFHFPGLEQVLLPSQGHHNCALYMWDVWPEASTVFWLTFFFRLGPYGVIALLCSIWSLEENAQPGFYFHWDILKSNL